MKKILGLLLVATGLLAGCATVDFQPYEGKTSVYEGTGGSKLVVDGIEFWSNGSPPRKFQVIGSVTSEIGSGYGDESLILSSVAAEVKAKGGNSAIQLTNNSSFSGMLRVSPSYFMAAGVKRMEFSVVKYVQ